MQKTQDLYNFNKAHLYSTILSNPDWEVLFRNIADYWTLVIRAEDKAFNRKDREGFAKTAKKSRSTAGGTEFAEKEMVSVLCDLGVSAVEFFLFEFAFRTAA
jgi:hypothetical protein